VLSVKEFAALKGRQYFVPMNSAAPSELCFPGVSSTQGVALGWHSIAPLGLKTKKTQPYNSYFKSVWRQLFSHFASLHLRVFALPRFPQHFGLLADASGYLNDIAEAP
jgi:hypothetical protein